MTQVTATYPEKFRRSNDLRGGSRFTGGAPDIASILDVDREYRAAVANASLDQRYDSHLTPGSDVATPVLRTRRGEWSYTASYSNSETCHALHRDHDWVVVQYDNGRGDRGRVTVVTAMRGPVRGRRIVRDAESRPPGKRLGEETASRLADPLKHDAADARAPAMA